MRLFLTLLLCAAPTLVTPMVFEDFTDDSTGWRYFSDQVMGGVSDGQASLAQDGDVTFARLTGDVSTANNGGFVQVRRDLTAPFADDSTGLTLTVRGNGEDYFVHLRTTNSRRPWQYYQASFPTTADWETVTLNWSDFTASGRGLTAPLTPEDIRSVGIVAYGKDHAADVSVAQIDLK
jgi:hypothetical protein